MSISILYNHNDTYLYVYVLEMLACIHYLFKYIFYVPFIHIFPIILRKCNYLKTNTVRLFVVIFMVTVKRFNFVLFFVYLITHIIDSKHV